MATDTSGVTSVSATMLRVQDSYRADASAEVSNIRDPIDRQHAIEEAEKPGTFAAQWQRVHEHIENERKAGTGSRIDIAAQLALVVTPLYLIAEKYLL